MVALRGCDESYDKKDCGLVLSSMCGAVPNAAWVEFIPQLDIITESRIEIDDGYAVPPSAIGTGISWNWKVIERMRAGHAIVS